MSVPFGPLLQVGASDAATAGPTIATSHPAPGDHTVVPCFAASSAGRG